MPVIDISVRERVAKVAGEAFIVCGNRDYIVRFDFDEEWAEHETKTAMFVYPNGDCVSKVFSGNSCSVPLIEQTDNIKIGVTAGDIRTTTGAYVRCMRSIFCNAETIIDEPSPDMLSELLQVINKKQNKLIEGEGIEIKNSVISVDENDVIKEMEVLSENLFDKTKITTDYIFYPSIYGQELISQQGGFYCYVEARGAGLYRAKVPVSLHGAVLAMRIPLVNSDYTFIRNAEAVVIENSDLNAALVQFEITENDITSGVTHFAYDGVASYADELMIVKDIGYPTKYIPYGYIKVTTNKSLKNQSNILYQKTALFFGDSICAGTSVGEDSSIYKYGWGGLIGEENEMRWSNYGVDGAIVTNDTSITERLITNQVDTAINEYPVADYVIFEGGVNDADYLYTDESRIGVLSEDYETFDTSTFVGAFESLVHKIVTGYANAKIGYIIPPKMGQGRFDSENSPRRQFFDKAVEVCKKWGIPYIDLWENNPLNPMLSVFYNNTLGVAQNINAGKFYTDGQHLSEKGYKKVAPQISGFMRSL